jgi:hypothetical protein
MTQMDLFQTATSSQQDTPASPFHLPGSAEAQKMTDISGHTFFPLLKPKDPLGAFSRMFMGMSLWASTKCYLTWKGKATPQGRSLFQLVPLTRLTDETEFGSSDEMWPTATARDYKGGRTPETLAKAGRNETNSLPDAVNAQMGKTGSLNPQWVEWLMGYPEGWTDLED